jgi:hypothetical protein
MSDQGDQIDVRRWIEVAEGEIDWVDGALCALGAQPTRDGIELYGLASLDAPSVAEYLRKLAAKLQVVATNLAYLADHAGLSPLAESLKVGACRKVDDSEVDGLTVDEMLDLLAEGGV